MFSGSLEVIEVLGGTRKKIESGLTQSSFPYSGWATISEEWTGKNGSIMKIFRSELLKFFDFVAR